MPSGALPVMSSTDFSLCGLYLGFDLSKTQRKAHRLKAVLPDRLKPAPQATTISKRSCGTMGRGV
jgi:hypothetical protein